MNKLLPLILLAFIAACGPQYETHYQMVTPQDPNGQYCASQCLGLKQNGQQFCMMQQQDCKQNYQSQAHHAYQAYVEQQRRTGQPINKSVSDFDDSFMDPNRCDATYSSCMENAQMNHNACHTSCGGQVIPQTVCTAFCNRN